MTQSEPCLHKGLRDQVEKPCEDGIRDGKSEFLEQTLRRPSSTTSRRPTGLSLPRRPSSEPNGARARVSQSMEGSEHPRQVWCFDPASGMRAAVPLTGEAPLAFGDTRTLRRTLCAQPVRMLAETSLQRRRDRDKPLVVEQCFDAVREHSNPLRNTWGVKPALSELYGHGRVNISERSFYNNGSLRSAPMGCR